MSCGTSANAMSLVTQTSRPIRGKGADVMFGLSALSAGSRLQDLATTTSIKRCLPNLTMLPILPWQIQMLLQLRVFVIQQGGRWWIRKHCWIPHSFSFLPSCLKKAWIHKYPYGAQRGAKSHVSLWHVILSILSSHACNLSIFLPSWGKLMG